jgi:hypothetical protein
VKEVPGLDDGRDTLIATMHDKWVKSHSSWKDKPSLNDPEWRAALMKEHEGYDEAILRYFEKP